MIMNVINEFEQQNQSIYIYIKVETSCERA